MVHFKHFEALCERTSLADAGLGRRGCGNCADGHPRNHAYLQKPAPCSKHWIVDQAPAPFHSAEYTPRSFLANAACSTPRRQIQAASSPRCNPCFRLTPVQLSDTQSEDKWRIGEIMLMMFSQLCQLGSQTPKIDWVHARSKKHAQNQSARQTRTEKRHSEITQKASSLQIPLRIRSTSLANILLLMLVPMRISHHIACRLIRRLLN